MLPGLFSDISTHGSEHMRRICPKKETLQTGLHRFEGFVLYKPLETGQSFLFVLKLHFAVVAV